MLIKTGMGIILAASLSFGAANVANAAVFNVSTPTELQNALAVAGTNQQPDVIQYCGLLAAMETSKQEKPVTTGEPPTATAATRSVNSKRPILPVLRFAAMESRKQARSVMTGI